MDYTPEQLGAAYKKAIAAGDIDSANEIATALNNLVESQAPASTPASKPTTISAPAPDSVDYGNRVDGTKKGSGFLGEIKLPNGQVATEVSIGVNINGKEVEIPTLVPTLTAEQRDFIAKGGNPLTRQDIVKTAIEHASKRIAAGLSPFNEPAAGAFTISPEAEAIAKKYR